MNVKNEIQYLLVSCLLADMAQAGLLTKEELATAKQLAKEKYRPETVWEL